MSLANRINPYGQRWSYVIRRYFGAGLFILWCAFRLLLGVLFIGLVYKLSGGK